MEINNYIYTYCENDDFSVENILLKNLNNSKLYICISKYYDSEYILNYFNSKNLNVELISHSTEINDSIILSFGQSLKIFWKNNKLFFINLFNEEYQSLDSIDYSFFISNNKVFLAKSKANILFYIEKEFIDEKLLEFIHYKILCNFYFKRDKNLFSVSSWYKIRLDLPIWKVCDKNCIFCNEWWEKFKYTKKNSIIQNKKSIIKEKPNWVILSDREPTFSEDFIENIKLCKKYDINTISVITSWWKFQDYTFCEESIREWLNEIRISIHWHNNEIHDAITQKKWSFNEIKKTLNNFSALNHKYKFDIFVLVVICKQNINYLKDILIFLKSFSISRISYSFVELTWNWYNNRAIVVPKITDAIIKIEELLKFYESKTKNENEVLNFENIPYCNIYHKYHRYLWLRTIHIWENYSTKNDKVTYFADQYRDKEFLESCKDCCLYDKCEWIHYWYKDIFWTEEFIYLKNVGDFNIININNTFLKSADRDSIIDIRDISNVNILKKTVVTLYKIWFKNFALRPIFLNNKILKILENNFWVKYFNLI